MENTIKGLIGINLLKDSQNSENFIGNLYHLNFDSAKMITNDFYKSKVGGLPQGSFLLAFYENSEKQFEEGILLRIINSSIPMYEDYSKLNLEKNYKSVKRSTIKEKQYKDFCGFDCKVLGTFFKDKNDNIKFGSDIESYYSAHNYKVYKLTGKLLEYAVNVPDRNKIEIDIPKIEKIGVVRYSSTRIRDEQEIEHAKVFIKPFDTLGRRTAIFGMTRTGKSSTLKKIIELVKNMSDKGDIIKDKKSNPIGKVGQIIFDIDGEYGNNNEQDGGTSIYELYKDDVERFSLNKKDGFKEMKINFYSDILGGFEMIKNHFEDIKDNSDYINRFLNISLAKPTNYDNDANIRNMYDRKIAAYKCCLFQAQFEAKSSEKVSFKGFAEIDNVLIDGKKIEPEKGISLGEATMRFEYLWDNYDKLKYIEKKKKQYGIDWAGEELLSILSMLTRKRDFGSKAKDAGYLRLTPLKEMHSIDINEPFELDIYNALVAGKIVIIDLSQGDSGIKSVYSRRITEKIFEYNIEKFISGGTNSYIQFYFEEAQNLFPNSENSISNSIYDRLAREGAKYKLGLVYVTQEVSSINSNILNNTENWFISHLNNSDEINELKKYYDFSDFADSLLRFSVGNDKGFARIKMLSNSFIIPVQIDLFGGSKSKK